jgi:L,D-transpeptidase ErfK/SrfK
MSCRLRFCRLIGIAACLSALSACSFLEGLESGAWRDRLAQQDTEESPDIAPDPTAPRERPLATRHFEGVTSDQEILGGVQVLFARYENTFVKIAREYNLGFDELRIANPGVDAWLPGEGTPIYLPTMSIVPDSPRDGILLNLPSMRLLYFVDDGKAGSHEAATLTVTSHPIGIGREGWATPTGEAAVTGKARDPVWYPPASVRAEHAELGDPLPSIVPAGPDNPLGAFAMGLSMPGYLIHGTNKPAGVGMRVSHGCIRLFPEDIEALFERVPSGTPVYIINEPVLAGWQDGELFLEVHKPLAEDERDLSVEAEVAVAAAFERAGLAPALVDPELVAQIVSERRGIPFPILSPQRSVESYLASARVIENVIPLAVAEATTDNETETRDLQAEASETL